MRKRRYGGRKWPFQSYLPFKSFQVIAVVVVVVAVAVVVIVVVVFVVFDQVLPVIDFEEGLSKS